MDKLLITAILAACFVVLRKLFSLFNKTKKVGESEEKKRSVKELEELIETIDETDFSNSEQNLSDEKHNTPLITTKNNWLYPPDEMGFTDNGVVYNAKTYEAYINKKGNGKTTIITIKK